MTTLEITKSYSGKHEGIHTLGNQAGKGSSQVVYRLTGANCSKVAKLLERDCNTSQELGELGDKFGGFSQVYGSILDAIAESGVAMPKYWDVIEGSKDGNIVTGFIQKYYQGLVQSGLGQLPNIGQGVSGGFTTEIGNDRVEDFQDFMFTLEGVSRFLDWDKYLLETAKLLRSESLESLTERIRTRKVDS